MFERSTWDEDDYVIGVDYGTLSGRAVVVRVRDGKELGSGVFDYPHAVVTDVLPADVAAVADGPAAQTELLAIDDGTTIRGFKKELAWNAAYYKLAGGL